MNAHFLFECQKLFEYFLNTFLVNISMIVRRGVDSNITHSYKNGGVINLETKILMSSKYVKNGSTENFQLSHQSIQDFSIEKWHDESKTGNEKAVPGDILIFLCRLQLVILNLKRSHGRRICNNTTRSHHYKFNFGMAPIRLGNFYLSLLSLPTRK